MDAKLTLKLDKEIIELAKKYAKDQGMSLSKYIEEFLQRRVKPEKKYELDEDGLLPEVRELMEHFKGGKKVKEPIDIASSKADYLIEKYGK
jgi:hypothetical protein